MVKIINVERALIVGAILLVVGVGMGIAALEFWTSRGFGPLQPTDTMRYIIPSATMIIIAFDLVYAAFFLSILEIRASAGLPPPEAAATASRQAVE